MAVLPRPSREVLLLHHTPRWRLHHAAFNPMRDAYWTAALLMPAVALAAAICLVGCTHLLLARRRYQMRNHETGVKKTSKLVLVMYLVLSLAAIATLPFTFYSSSLIRNGNRAACGDIDLFERTTSVIVTTAEGLPWQLRQATGNITMAKQSLNTSCNASAPLPSLREVEAFKRILTTVGPLIVSVVGEVQPLLTSSRHDISLFGDGYTVLFTYILFPVVLIVQVALATSVYLRKPYQALICALATQMLAFLTLAGGSFMFFALEIAADFCVNPTGSLLSTLPPSAYSIVVLFSDCASVSVSSYLVPFTRLLSSVDQEIHAVIPAPPPHDCNVTYDFLHQASTLINDSILSLEATTAALDCGKISDAYNDLFSKDLCGAVFDGVFGLMVISYVVGICTSIAGGLSLLIMQTQIGLDSSTTDRLAEHSSYDVTHLWDT